MPWAGDLASSEGAVLGQHPLDAEGAQRLGVGLRRVLWACPRGAEDALRATDLILALDGFGLVVLYLSGTPAPRRMDHAWLRLQQRCARSRTALLLVTDRPLAGPSAAATLTVHPGPVQWSRVPGGRAVLEGRAVSIEVTRSKLGMVGATGALYLAKERPR